MATERLSALDPLQLLQYIIGGTTNTDKSGTSSENASNTTNVTGSQNQSQTGSTNTTLNSTQGTTGTTGSTGTNTSSTSGTTATNQTTTGTADIKGLQDILAKQQAGVTPEALAAIFQQGSEQVPAIVTALGNAVGARSTSNDPIAQALTMLNSKLVQQAATMQQGYLSDASSTAARIADATRQQTMTGTNTQTGTQTGTQDQTQTTNQTTNTNSSQAVNNLLNTLLNSNQGTTQNGTKTGTTSDAVDQTTAINQDQLLKVLAVALGGSALNNALPGGLGGLLGSLTGSGSGGASGGASGGGGIVDLIKKLVGGSGPSDSQIGDLINGQNNGSNPYQDETDALTRQLLDQLTNGGGSAQDFWDMIGIDPASTSLPNGYEGDPLADFFPPEDFWGP